MGIKTFDRANPAKKQIEVYNQFDGGINTELSDNVMGDNEFRELINFDMDKAGSIVKRPGLYRIPYIKQILDEKIDLIIENKLIYNGTDTSGNKVPVDKAELKIEDCIQFYDGEHWVFNFITNFGLFVLLLNKDMSLPSELYTDEWERACMFLPNGDGNLAEKTVYRTKISQFNDTWVLFKSYFAKPGSEDSATKDKKQVEVYNWNPIYDASYIYPGEEEPRELYIGWKEAVNNQEEIIEDIKYGAKETKSLSSKQFREIPELINPSEEDNGIISVRHTGESDSTGIFGNYNEYNENIKVEFKSQGTSSWLEIWKKSKSQPQWDERNKYQVFIRHQNGVPISFSDILWIVYRGCGKLTVYLKTPVKYNPLFLGKTDESFVSKSQQQIYWIHISLLDSTPSAFYSTYFSQVPYEDATNGRGFIYQELNASKKTTNVNEFTATPLIGRLTDGGTDCWANRVVFTKDGCPFKVKCSWTPDSSSKYGTWKGPNEVTQNSVNYSMDSMLLKKVNKAWKLEDSPNPPTGIGMWAVRPSSSNPYVVETVVNDFMDFWAGPPYNDSTLQAQRNSTGLAPLNDNDINNPRRDLYWTNSVNQQSYGYFTYRQDLNITYNKRGWTWALTEEGASNVYKHGIKKDWFGFNTSEYTVTYKEQGETKTAKVYSSFLDKNNFKLMTMDEENIYDILEANNIIIKNEVFLKGTDLFKKEDIEALKEINDNNWIQTIRLKAKWSFLENGQLKNDSRVTSLKKYALGEFISSILSDEKKIRVDITKNKNKYYRVSYSWQDSAGNWRPLFTQSSSSIPNWTAHSTEIVESTSFLIIYDWLVGGYLEQVLHFKSSVYVKPNLNDLNNLWYNLVLFSNYSDSRNPDIYDSVVHPNISSDLLDYPKTTLTGSKIQLFGIQPVNNLILTPGKQRFQLFYKKAPDAKYSDFIVAVTAMTIADYTAMISSDDYSTTGYKGEGSDEKAVKGPPWVEWDTQFKNTSAIEGVDNSLDDDPDGAKPAIFELEIPSTTQPYMVLVQVAEKEAKNEGEEGETKLKPIVATVVETRIEMQPSSSYIQKVDVSSLFDEFTTTDQFVTYSTSIIGFGSSNKLFFSDSGLSTYFPLSQIIQLKTPETIRSCVVFQNKLIVATENSRFYIGGSSFGTDSDPYYLKEVSSDSGIIAPKSNVPMGNFLYFLDNDGIKILKNLYGTADKEFAYENIDVKIKQLVSRDREAVGVAFQNKYYLNFPENKYMLVYNFDYKAWVAYESDYMNFSRMFVNDGKLYAVDRDNFVIYEFRDDVYVDNWNEEEDGYKYVKGLDGSALRVQDGTLIKCSLKTKNYDQAYVPHQKKYDWAVVSAVTEGAEEVSYLELQNEMDHIETVNTLTPYIFVDGDLINYRFTTTIKEDTQQTIITGKEPQTIVYNYVSADTYEDENGEPTYWPEPVFVRSGSTLNKHAIVDGQMLGKTENSYYNIPIRRKGNTISLELIHKDFTKISINSLSIRYGINVVKRNRRGIS